MMSLGAFFLMSFPMNFISTKDFALMKVTALPIKSSKFPNIFIKYKLKKYLAINGDNQYFETNDLSECKVMKRVHVCPLTTSLSNNHDDNYSLSLLNNVVNNEKLLYRTNQTITARIFTI